MNHQATRPKINLPTCNNPSQSACPPTPAGRASPGSPAKGPQRQPWRNHPRIHHHHDQHTPGGTGQRGGDESRPPSSRDQIPPPPRPLAERPGDQSDACPPPTTPQRPEEEIRESSLPFWYPSSATNGERPSARGSRCLTNGCCGTAAAANGIRRSAPRQRCLPEPCQPPRLRPVEAARLSPPLWAGAGGRGQRGGAGRRFPAFLSYQKKKKKNNTKTATPTTF